MDKNKIKSFALSARSKLEQDIIRDAGLIGITENGLEEPLVNNLDYVKFNNGKELYGNAIKQREQLVNELSKRARMSTYKESFNSLVEEIAYTWFNRIIAIRFMEVNNYLDGIRVLSSNRENDNEPQIVREVFDSDLDFSNEDKNYIYELKENNKNDKLFKFIFIKKCNKLNEMLPELFEKTNDYTELLLPISIKNAPEEVLYKLINEIPEDNFNIQKEGQVEIIGWLYQYYNEEKKKEIDRKLKIKKVVTKDELPAKTQLFTPKWIVKYMVENSLGHLWLSQNSNENLEQKWKYYIKDTNQELEVRDELERLNSEDLLSNIEEIKIIDPCMGSGHILVYVFDLLMDIYLSNGYLPREAARLIIENNIYGTDIDKRAYQLSYFALMMKAREHDRRILTRKIKFKLYHIENYEMSDQLIKFISNNNKNLEKQLVEINNQFKNASEYGSLLSLNIENYELIDDRIKEIEQKEFLNLFDDNNKKMMINEFKYIFELLKVLMSKYDIVLTNPPYMGSSMMNSKLSEYVKKYYSNSKSDLFAAFIEKCSSMTKNNRYYSMITMHSWMFLGSYEKLRLELNNTDTISMLHLGSGAFDEIRGDVVQATAWVERKSKIKNYMGKYFRLVDVSGEKNQKNEFIYILQNNNSYKINKINFKKIPGNNIGYWINNNMLKNFENGTKVENLLDAKQGLATADNDRFLRLWWEINKNKMKDNLKSIDEVINSDYKWCPYNKGGERRQWYGNYDYVVNWENNGYEIRNFRDKKGKLRSRPQNMEYYFKEAITWSLITSGEFSIRYRENGSIHDVAGMSAFNNLNNNISIKYILGLMSTKISNYVFKILNPTINLQIGDFNNFPIIENNNIENDTIKLVEDNIKISKYDWNTFETSWNFKFNPLIDVENYISQYSDNENKNISGVKIKLIEESYNDYKEFTNNQFAKLKENEEELNKIFIDLYGLQDELDYNVADKDITIAKIFDKKEEISDEIKGNKYILTREMVIKQFISYFVGCLFGRYSLDLEGLACAGGEFDNSKYDSFIPDTDNCVPIADNEYFNDDIVKKFIEFVEIVYGKETLEENLKFIVNSISDSTDDVKSIIRNYFLNDFYKDHLKMYKKKPIYWQYDSGKKNGFKALIYVHRYNEQTTVKVRVDYLHKLQKNYERKIEFLNNEVKIEGRTGRKAKKELKKIQDQLDECKQFDEKLNHLSSEYISIDLDDGIAVNHNKIQTSRDGKLYNILTKLK